MYLAESDFGKLIPLVAFTTNPNGAAVVQTISPLKTLASNGRHGSAFRKSDGRIER
jgi:hypothetical protein